MALSTYAELQAAIGTWNVDRTDLPTADLVALAEARLNRELRLRAMEADATLAGVVGSRTISQPAGFLEPLALGIVRSTGREQLRFVPADLDYSLTAGEPRAWSVEGANIAFDRPCDQAYAFSLRHLARFALSDAAPTNWLLTNYPDAYLAAANIEAALYQLDDEQALRWQARYADALAAISAKEARSRSMTTLNVDAALLNASSFDITRG